MPSLALAHVTASNAPPPKRWVLFLHGILGSGANWRGFAQKLVTARPDWGASLVDLRLHGRSLDGFAPPHTLAAAANDVVESLAEVPGPVASVLGHSFGGKVALAVGGILATRAPLDHLFIVDASPSPRVPDRSASDSALRILDLLETMPPDGFPSRPAFVAWAEKHGGLTKGVAQWLAMNVRPTPDSERHSFRLDLAGIRALVLDYFSQDLWPVLEGPLRDAFTSTHLVVGGQSATVDRAARARAASCPRTTVDVIAEAGHWVHVDAPDALHDLIVTHLELSTISAN